jgi:uncharacterized protein (TIGR02145 family)/uncharacterized repeat protein (TIGR02543 family)
VWIGGTRSLVFNVNGGTWSNGTVETKSVESDKEGWGLSQSRWPEEPIRTNYDFLYWYMASSLGSNPTDVLVLRDGWEISRDGVNVYAIWVWSGSAHVITFDANGGNALVPASGGTGVGGVLTSGLPTPRRKGWYFDGWYTERSGGTRVSGSTAFDGPATIYAHWADELPAGGLEDLRDGKIYVWQKIGTQTWMIDNLNYWGEDQGKEIGMCQGNVPANCTEGNFTGRKYTWEEAMDGAVSSSESPSGGQGVCPVGSYLPSKAELETLLSYLGGDPYDGIKVSHLLRDDYKFNNNGYGTYRPAWQNPFAMWWSSTERDASTAERLWVGDGNEATLLTGTPSLRKDSFVGVRCVMDE